MNFLPDLLAEIERTLRRYVAFRSRAQSVAIALWIAHTFVVEAFDQTLYLLLT